MNETSIHSSFQTLSRSTIFSSSLGISFRMFTSPKSGTVSRCCHTGVLGRLWRVSAEALLLQHRARYNVRSNGSVSLSCPWWQRWPFFLGQSKIVALGQWLFWRQRTCLSCILDLSTVEWLHMQTPEHTAALISVSWFLDLAVRRSAAACLVGLGFILRKAPRFPQWQAALSR